jgi:hypothetical protein
MNAARALIDSLSDAAPEAARPAAVPVDTAERPTPLREPGPLYTIHAFTQQRDCRHCGPCEVEVEGPIETRLETFSEDIALAADDEAESLGWKSGYCPHCAWEHREYLRAEHHADFCDDD